MRGGKNDQHYIVGHLKYMDKMTNQSNINGNLAWAQSDLSPKTLGLPLLTAFHSI